MVFDNLESRLRTRKQFVCGFQEWMIGHVGWDTLENPETKFFWAIEVFWVNRYKFLLFSQTGKILHRWRV